MSEPFIGQICMFGFSFPPRGWATCDGQLMPIAQQSALFSLLGTTYGGDGITTFALPDLRGRAALHQGTGPGRSSRTIGEVGGSESVSLSVDQLAKHVHSGTLNAKAGAGKSGTPQGAYPAAIADGYGTTSDTTMASDVVVTTPTGNNAPHENMQPFLVVNCCIALDGIYPSRS